MKSLILYSYFINKNRNQDTFGWYFFTRGMILWGHDFNVLHTGFEGAYSSFPTEPIDKFEPTTKTDNIRRELKSYKKKGISSTFLLAFISKIANFFYWLYYFVHKLIFENFNFLGTASCP